MNTKKQNLINQLRSHYQKKFGNIKSIQNLLEIELAKINEKSKISPNDFQDLEARLLAKSQKDLFESSPQPIKKNSRINLKSISKESDDSLLQTQLNESLVGSPKIYPYYLKKELQEFQKMKGSHSLNLSAIDIKNLQLHNNSLVDEDKNLKKIKSGIIEKSFMDCEIVKEPKPNDLARFKLSPIHKTQQRDNLLKQNIWKKIDEYNQKKFDQEEMNKKMKAKQNQEKWLVGLKDQVEQSQKKKEEERLRIQEENKKYINYEIDAQLDREKKIELDKQRIRSLERDNYLNSIKMQELKRDQRRYNQLSVEKIQDVTPVNKDWSKEEAHNSILLAKELDKMKKKEQLERMIQEAELIRVQKSQNKLLQNEEDNKVIQHMMEKMEQDEKLTQKFVEKLRDRSRVQKEPVKIEKKKRGYDNLRRYGSIGGQLQNKSEGIMGFLHSEAHNEAIQKEKKLQDIEKLKQVHETQKNDRLEKKKVHEQTQNEQRALWVKEEELMNVREDIHNEIEKLKKQVTKQGLDMQRDSNEKYKKGLVTPTEIWVNRKLLREIKAVPEGFSDKISFSRSVF